MSVESPNSQGDELRFALKCDDVIRELSNYLDGELDWELLFLVEKHLAGCGRCTAVVSGMRNVTCLLAEQRALEVPEHLSERLYLRLRPYLCEL